MAVQVSSRTCRKILETLPRERLWELLDHFEISVPDRRVIDGVVTGLVQAVEDVGIGDVLSLFNRKELQDVCEALGVEAGGREKEGYRARILERLREMQIRARAVTASRASSSASVDEDASDEPQPAVARARRARVEPEEPQPAVARTRRPHVEPAEVRPPAPSRRGRGESVVFIVHGQDDAMRLEIRAFLEKLGLRAIVLQEEPNKGLTILEKQEKHRAESAYAVVLLSPDDVGYSVKAGEQAARPRARQNVILELGMMLGALGRGRVAVLHSGELELPSDIQGLVYIGYERRHADSAKWQLARELKHAGFDVDLNQAL